MNKRIKIEELIKHRRDEIVPVYRGHIVEELKKVTQGDVFLCFNKRNNKYEVHAYSSHNPTKKSDTYNFTSPFGESLDMRLVKLVCARDMKKFRDKVFKLNKLYNAENDERLEYKVKQKMENLKVSIDKEIIG